MKSSPTMLKQTAMILAVIMFIAAFLAGVGFTVYRTGATGTGALAGKQEIDNTKKEKMLKAEVQRNPNNTTAWIQLGHVYFDTESICQRHWRL